MKTGPHVKAFEFDREYFERLRNEDPEIMGHFATYFGPRLDAKFRSCLRDSALADDLRQETLGRVLMAVQKGGPQQPHRFEAFVNAVCKNVLFEYWRSARRYSVLPENTEWVDSRCDPEQEFRHKEALGQLTRALHELPTRDRQGLTLV